MKHSIDHIINKYSSSLFKICLGYSNSFEEAQDLLQDVFVNVWKGLNSFKEESTMKTWLFRITVNTCLLSLRKKSISTVSLENIDNQLISDYSHNSEQSNSFESLHKLIQNLPPKDRTIILLYLEGLTYQEIANIIGITPNYIGVKMSRIKHNLSSKIKDNG